MTDFSRNVWAPWRMEYIRSLGQEHDDVGCFLCHYWEHPEDDAANLVLWRRDNVFVVMNRFPYTNGHLLIAPMRHEGSFVELDEATLHGLQLATRDAIRTLGAAFSPQGFNVGYNVGKCAGAGLPDHLHAHVVPRWSADTNYMAVLGGVRVIPEGLLQTYDRLLSCARDLGVATAGS